MTSPVSDGTHQQKGKTSKLKTAAGTAAALAVYKVPSNIVQSKVNPKLMQKMKDINNSLTSDEFKRVSSAVEDAIGKTGLDKKGVNIIKVTSENSEAVREIMAKELDKGIIKFFPKKIKDIAASMYTATVESGGNAFYAFKTKNIVLPEKGLILAGFHEIGHAMNNNLSIMAKSLQSCRPLTLLSIPITFIALFKNKKANGEESKNKIDKVTDFVRNNAGKLTFLSWLPLIAEEGLATLKGNKLAKNSLDSDIVKKVAKGNAYGLATYVLCAAASSFGISMAVKLKDAITSSKDKKTQQD